MKKALIICLIILCILVGGGTYAYTSFAYSHEETVLKSEIIEIKGSVMIQPASSVEWKQVFVGDEIVAGDTIKTGPSSFVVLSFFDNSTSRLDENTEISIDILFYNPDKSYEQRVGIDLVRGTAWSRVLRLIDKDSDFYVQTPTAVATVRGTALDVSVDEEGKTDVKVADNIVDVQAVKTIQEKDPTTGKRKLKVIEKMAMVSVPEDNRVVIDINKLPITEQDIVMEKISEEIKKTDWFQKNESQDMEFEKAMKEKELRRIEDKEKILPDSPLYGIKKAVEKIDVSFTKDDGKKMEKELDFARRRFEEALILEQKGDSEASKKLIVEYESNMKDKISDALSLDQEQKKFFGEKVDEFMKRNEKALSTINTDKTGDYTTAIDSIQKDLIEKNPMNFTDQELKMKEMEQLKRKFIDLKEKKADQKEYLDIEQKRIKLEQEIKKFDKNDEINRSMERINLYRDIGTKELQNVKDILNQAKLLEEQKTNILNQVNDALKTLNNIPTPTKPLIDPNTKTLIDPNALNLLNQTPVVTTDPQKFPDPTKLQPTTTTSPTPVPQPIPTAPIINNPYGLTSEQYKKFIDALIRVEKLEVFKNEPFEKQKLWIEFFKDGFTDFSIMR